MAKRLVAERCCGVVIDVQDHFLAQIDKRLRSKIKTNTRNFVRLLGYFHIPIVATVERPLETKGVLPPDLGSTLNELDAATFEKDFFDLTREKKIRDHVARLKKTQMLVAGCETDVCVLQSCLGLMNLGYEVYLVEETLFSSARNVEAAMTRLKSEGAILLSYKTLYFELIEAVGNERLAKKFGPFPDDLPETAV